MGSSPHTRGAHRRAVRQRTRVRIIPAYAGSTSTAGTTASRRSDHPRIRGEHKDSAASLHRQRGSSPHTRGAQGYCRSNPTCWRIIPAYAGSTLMPILDDPQRPDHPRIRGEHIAEEALAQCTEGSSPHTRGALGEELAEPSDHQDHPRIRGEHTSSTAPMDCCRGSSPHTRGARRFRGGRAAAGRIIPAYAGSTTSSIRWTRSRWDHPRIRGEH